MIIIINYLEPYNCEQIICVIWRYNCLLRIIIIIIIS